MEAADVASISLFSGLDEAECAEIADLFQEETVLPGRRPAIQSDFGYRFFVILDGSAVVRVDGKEVGTLGSGDFFGELALLDDDGKRKAEVETTSHTRYASMLVWEFRKLFENRPDIKTKIEAAIAEYRS